MRENQAHNFSTRKFFLDFVCCLLYDLINPPVSFFPSDLSGLLGADGFISYAVSRFKAVLLDDGAIVFVSFVNQGPVPGIEACYFSVSPMMTFPGMPGLTICNAVLSPTKFSKVN